MIKKLILLLIGLPLAAVCNAQELTIGESDPFWIESNKTWSVGADRLYSAMGFIRCYVNDSGERQFFFVVTTPRLDEVWDISEGASIVCEYSDGSRSDGKVHKIDTYSQTLPAGGMFSYRKHYTQMCENTLNIKELQEKKVSKIIIRRDGGDIYDVRVKEKYAEKLRKKIGDAIEQASAAADAKKERTDNIDNYFSKNELPNHALDYMTETYPGTSCNVLKADTVELPYRVLMSLEVVVALDQGKLSDRFLQASEMSNIDERNAAYSALLHIGDSLCKAHSEQLTLQEIRAKNPSDDYMNYRRWSVELVTHASRDTVDIFTRLGEEDYISFHDFLKKKNDVSSKIADFKAYLDRRREAMK